MRRPEVWTIALAGGAGKRAYQLFASGAGWNTMVIVARARSLLERSRATC